MTILQIFADTCRKYAERPAVIDGDRTLTYADLDRASDALATALVRRGLQPEDAVVVHQPRGAGVFVALLGILKAGGAYVPIDVMYPAARRDLMIRASGAVAAVTTAELAPLPLGTFTIAPEGGAPEAGTPDAGTPDAVAPGEVPPERAACVLFTSGSTGRPKPIVLEHRNLAYFAVNDALPPLEPADRVAHVSSVSFDAFHFETWCALAAGAAIVVLPTLPDLVGGDVQRELRRHRITAMLAATMAVNHLIREDRETFAGLRILHTGGDVILPSVCRDLIDGGFGGRFFNLYGPTEGTTACTAYEIREGAPQADTVPIGRPLAGAHIYLLDEEQQPVAAGAPGEIYIGGAGVARGYLGLAAETEARFLTDPFTPGGRMYRTGDLARWNVSGELEFLSRVDDQVKIRGYRVEPREAERVLTRHESVFDAAVLVEGEGDSRYLVAIVAGVNGISVKQLRDYATETLPDYLVPAAIVVVDQIPANEHGKRDAAKLRELACRELERRRTLVAPRDDCERHLAEVWQDLLAVEQVGADDDFFALGGNSMLAFRLRRRLTRELDVELDMHEVLNTTVLSGLADLIRARS